LAFLAFSSSSGARGAVTSGDDAITRDRVQRWNRAWG
jgi:hypothetical protein